MGVRASVVNRCQTFEIGALESNFDQTIAKPRDCGHLRGAIVILFRTSASVNSALSRSTQTDFAEPSRPVDGT